MKAERFLKSYQDADDLKEQLVITATMTALKILFDSHRLRDSPSRPDQPYLMYPSNSNLVWLREAGIDLPDDIVPEQVTDSQAGKICDAFGLFGTAEECLDRLKRAADYSDVEHVFIFPTHTQDGGYDMPRREVDAFRNVIFPGLATGR